MRMQSKHTACPSKTAAGADDEYAFERNRVLRELVAESGLTLAEVLARFNARQARPIALRTLKSYLAGESAKSRVRCPVGVLHHMQVVLSRVGLRSNVRKSEPKIE